MGFWITWERFDWLHIRINDVGWPLPPQYTGRVRSTADLLVLRRFYWRTTTVGCQYYIVEFEQRMFVFTMFSKHINFFNDTFFALIYFLFILTHDTKPALYLQRVEHHFAVLGSLNTFQCIQFHKLQDLRGDKEWKETEIRKRTSHWNDSMQNCFKNEYLYKTKIIRRAECVFLH